MIATIKRVLKNIIPEPIFFKIQEWRKKNSNDPFFANERKFIEDRKIFLQKYIVKNDLVFDIGANEGNRVTSLLAVGAKVIAVEPQPNCVKILSRKFGNQIQIIPKGVGSKPGTLEMFISESSTLSTFSKDWKEKIETGRFKEAGWKNSIQVDIVTLDSIIKEYGIPKFIKIDVEGFELEVMKGLSTSIPVISFEYAVPEQIDNLIACVNQLNTINSNTKFNYCIGEIMEFELPNWVTAFEMNEVIKSKAFIQSAFGDIYASTINL